MRLPKLSVVHILDLFPGARRSAVALPANSEVAIVKSAHLRRQPRRNVDAIRDVPDGHCIFGLAGIQALPHGARHLAMQRRNCIGAPRKLQPQHSHAELFPIVGGIFAAEAHKVLLRDAQLIAQRSQVLLDEVGIEPVVAGGHRRMRGKDYFAGNLAGGMVEVQALFFHAIANGLKDREAAVSLVQVENAGRDAHGLERAESTHKAVTSAHDLPAHSPLHSSRAGAGRFAPP